MNLFNTQIGDIFYVLKTVKAKSGWQRFFVAQKVTKTTRTQITLENGVRYKMETRRAIGKNCQLFSLGMGEWVYAKRTVTDDTEDFYNFVSQNRDAQIV